MKLIAVALLLVACSWPPTHKNRAVDFASRVAPQAVCTDWGSTADGNMDIALCELNAQLWICRAGADDPSCKMVADLRPPAPTGKVPGVPADAAP